uniref:Uncharacterized protein n=1 Tax=Anopheles farauti TaxID=69004 RepID=A0A182QRI9_9DIPT
MTVTKFWSVYYSWQKHHVDQERRAISIIQLCLDMTGYGYTFTPQDIALLTENVSTLYEDKIMKAPFVERDFLASSAFVANLTEFWNKIIVHHWKDLLRDNDWFNKTVMLVLMFCKSSSDECAMVGSFVGTIIVQQLCTARHKLLKDVESASVLRDTHRRSSLKRKLDYIDQVSLALLTEVVEGLQYARLSALLMKRICETFEAYPQLMVDEYKQLDLLAIGLMSKNRPSIQVVLKCLQWMIKNCNAETSQACGLFVMRFETQLLQVSDAYKSFETIILQLFLQAQTIVGTVLLSENSMENIIFKMFGKDEAVINTAIDLHGIYFTALHVPAALEKHALVAILDVFERYEYPLASLDTVTRKLWEKGFFRRFDDLFTLLINANAAFLANCMAHVINYCHQLLMEDIRTRITPSAHSSESVSWNGIRRRIQSFVKGYPACLQAVSQCFGLYSLLLKSLNPENNELYRVAGVDCESYYTAVLFNTLAKVAMEETIDYTALFHTLTSIHNFDSVCYISEDVWKELTDKYYTFFFHTRSRLRRYNMGIDSKQMKLYTVAILRLCILTEINNATEEVFTLAEYLANDLRLLSNMSLSEESKAIFYRLYKNTLYAVVRCCLEHPSKNHPTAKFNQYGKRVQAFMSVLVDQLNYIDSEFAVSRHIANAMCNMLVLTQECDSKQWSPMPLKDMVFKVEPAMLQKLATYVERQVFVEQALSDEGQNYLLGRKLMLTAYGDVYRLHHALPRKTDLCYIFKHFGTNSPFTQELEQLLYTLYASDSNDFYKISAQVMVMFVCKPHAFQTKLKVVVSTVITKKKSLTIEMAFFYDYRCFGLICTSFARIACQTWMRTVILSTSFDTYWMRCWENSDASAVVR